MRLADGAIGASERLVVSPGREAAGSLHIAGGQSGHPLSPYCRDQQTHWLRENASPFLAGVARHRLRLMPKNPRLPSI
ncbi:MAG: penicillin acylase family protein [Gammaproteobacteria bacterium]